MGWIWVIFLVFSVFANLLEKMAQEKKAGDRHSTGQQTPGPSTDNGGWEFETPPTMPTETFPQRQPVPTSVWEEALPEWNQLFTAEQDPKEERAMFPESEDWEFPGSGEWQRNGESRARQLQDAFVLAHALSRPDFQTVPWRRRL